MEARDSSLGPWDFPVGKGWSLLQTNKSIATVVWQCVKSRDNWEEFRLFRHTGIQSGDKYQHQIEGLALENHIMIKMERVISFS